VSYIERGHHTCWYFRVRHPVHEGLFETQYEHVSAFPHSRDGCNTAASCGGNVTWACTVLRNRPGVVRLRWKYPSDKLAPAFSVGAVCLVVAAVMASQRILAGRRDRARDADADEDGRNVEDGDGDSHRDSASSWFDSESPRDVNARTERNTETMTAASNESAAQWPPPDQWPTTPIALGDRSSVLQKPLSNPL
jgi:hypothetical protein